MNWETYKTLTDDQKKEYDFRFKDKPLVIDGGKLISSVTLFLMVVTQFLMTIFLAMTHEAFTNLRDQVIILLQTTSRIVGAMTIIIVVFLLTFAITSGYRIYIEQKWMKDNKIKKAKSKPLWKRKRL